MKTSLFSLIAPSATTQIRADHAHVLSAFHQFGPYLEPGTKQVIVNTVCRALDIHARLEEELFYPAMRELAPALIDKSVPEHQAMHARIYALLAIEPTHPEYDAAVIALMHDVMRHVTDEETTLLPQAERLLGGRLHEIGAQMVTRRIALVAARSGEMARDALSRPGTSIVLAAASASIAATYLAGDAVTRAFGALSGFQRRDT